MTSGSLYRIVKEWSSLVQKTTYFYLLLFALCKHPTSGASSDIYSVSACVYIGLRFTSVAVLAHSGAFLKQNLDYFGE